MQLPPAGDDVPVRLRVRPCGRTEQWLRSFNDCSLRSLQTEWDGLLLETCHRVEFYTMGRGESRRLEGLLPPGGELLAGEVGRADVRRLVRLRKRTASGAVPK